MGENHAGPYPKSLYDDATTMKAAGVDFSLLNAYALTRMIWARYNAEEGDAEGHQALFVAARPPWKMYSRRTWSNHGRMFA